MRILFIRGLTRQKAHWGQFPQHLAKVIEEKKDIKVELLFEDLPGFGSRYKETSPGSIEKIAERLLPTIERYIQVNPEKIHLIGISMGGLVAAELTHRFPQWFASLSLINSSFASLSPWHQRMQIPALWMVLKAWFHPSKHVSEKAILTLSSPRNQNNQTLLSTWVELRKSEPPSRKASIQQLIAAACYVLPSHAPLERTLVIASKGDRLASYHCSETLAQFWQVPLILHPSAGHDLPLEDEIWLVSQLQTMLV